MVKPDHRSEVEAEMQRAMEGKCQFHSQFPILRHGEVRWIEAIGNFVFDSQGTAVRIGFDVTERKRMEEALRESEERFRMATQAANEAIWELDVASGCVSWSENFTRFYGRTQNGGSSIGWWLNRLHSEDRERVVSSLNSALSGRATSWDCEYRFRKPDDSWATVYDRALIARTVDGKATRVIGAMLDTTELHVTRQQLKVLSGLLPICAVCKKIRDGDGTWHVMESYIHTHSEAKFSHGLCPECVTTWYGSESDPAAAP
jgi:PAS domain S-box-containing protein